MMTLDSRPCRTLRGSVLAELIVVLGATGGMVHACVAMVADNLRAANVQ